MRGVIFAIALAACAGPSQHGKPSALSTASSAGLCDHGVPADVCTRCHPELAAGFQRVGDWCGEHGVPESQCFACHPDLSFAPPPPVPEGADLAVLVKAGEDVPDLAPHAVAGKVTVFDFYAEWCAPCRDLTLKLYDLLRAQPHLAVRTLNLVSWDSPLAQRYLGEVGSLPLVVIYDTQGRERARLAGAQVEAQLERVITEASP